MNVFKLNKEKKLEKPDLQEAVSVLKKGGVVIVPTDTSYGMAALVTSKKGVAKVFKLKGRGKQKTSSMVVKSRAQALEYGRISCKPTALWKAFLPGPLTLVVEAKKKLDYITRKDKTVGIRRIDTPVVNQLLKQLPGPLTITSANRSSKPDIYSLRQFSVQYKNKTHPEIFLDAGALKKRKSSTVVACHDTIEVLREGPISANQISKALEKQ
jgi:L-threonylcarbamoyladenylate synthase